MDLISKNNNLEKFFRENNKVAIGFSGGVDSSYLIYMAKKHCEKPIAYYVKSQFQPEFEYLDAKKLADFVGIEMRVIEVDVLKDEKVVKNPANRCYYCKCGIFSAILERAKADGFNLVIDGTNASDNQGDRPGMVALRELSVMSPLRDCLLTKLDIRKLSREVGLFTSDKYSYACLATRIAPLVEISKELLEKIEVCEDFLTQLGFKDFRLRTDGLIARLEITKEDNALYLERETDIENFIKAHFSKWVLEEKRRILEVIA